MRYIIDLHQNHANEIESLIKKGKYQNFAQFIATAVENQIYMEKTEIKGDSSVEHSNQKHPAKMDHDSKGISTEDSHLYLPIPDIFPSTVPPPSFPELVDSLEGVEEEKCWLWGQTNKIFPIKLGLRAFLKYIGKEGWMDLELFTNNAANSAWAYGVEISRYEEMKRKKRDEKISAGLPRGMEEFKSKMRYKGHFLAYIRKDDKLGGALPFLRFANLTRKENGNLIVGITDFGLRFACLYNPVIDKKDFDVSLSEKEISFYLDHIAENVKGEYAAFKWLLRKLAEGVVHREEINKALKEELGDVWKTSDAVINTQRAGLMARMVELGLIDRVRKGIRVYYYISDRGKTFMKEALSSY